MKLLKMKKVVDERQELELLRIQNAGFWILYFGIAVHMFAQIFLGDFVIRFFIGELIVMMIGGVYVSGACAKKGIWSGYFKPDAKTYLLFSLGAAAAVGGVQIAIRVRFNGTGFSSEFLLMLAFNIVFSFALAFLLLAVSARITKKRASKLESDFNDQN